MENVHNELYSHTSQLLEYLACWREKQEALLANLENTGLDSPMCLEQMSKGICEPDHREQFSHPVHALSFATDHSLSSTTGSPVPSDSDSEPLGSTHIRHMSQSLGLDVALHPRTYLRYVSDSILDMVHKLKTCQCCWRPSRSCLRRIVTHRMFDTLSSLVIAANAVLIAHSSNHAVQHPNDPETWEIAVAERLFGAIYSVELLFRLVAEGIVEYFRGADWRWNTFDAALVFILVYDQLIIFLEFDSANLSFLRIARLFKMLRVLRIFRLMRAFRELRLILASVLASLKSLTWAVIMLFIVTFTFGIFFLQASVNFLADLEQHGSAGEQAHVKRALKKYWGSIFTAMHTLFSVSTNGEDWNIPAEPLWDVGLPIYILFLFYVAFFVFVVTNTLTSLFVEITLANSERDLEAIINEELKKKEDYITTLRRFFLSIDKDHTGHISYDEFLAHMEAPQMIAFASQLDIDATDVSLFFKTFSLGGKRSVDLETFVVGCIKLRGNARSMDLLDLIHQHKRACRRLQSHHTYCREQFHKIHHALQDKRPRFPHQENTRIIVSQHQPQEAALSL